MPPVRCFVRTVSLFVMSVVPVLALVNDAQTGAASRQATLDRAVAHFAAGRVTESVAEFDNFVRLAPEDAPALWQRGIALYYAGRYADCRAQFESHRTVNPADVENAAWHFLCVARADSPQRAKAMLLPVGPDRRVPMHEIYEMFRGELGPDEVFAAAGSRLQALFYAHLYVGLYSEAIGNRAQTLEHIKAAADPQYAAAGNYMHIVARVHLARLSGR